MIFQESNRVRRIVGRLEEGEDCVEQLTDFCKKHDISAAEVRAVGRFDQIEVVRFDPEAGEYTPVFSGEGNFDLLNLSGNVSRLGDQVVLRLEAMIAAQGPVGPQVITGQLRSGRAVEFEFVLEVFEDLELRRRLDNETGLLSLQAIRKEEPPAEPEAEPDATEAAAEKVSKSKPMEGKSMSWDDASEATRQKSGTSNGSNGARKTKRKKGSAEEKDVNSIYGDMDMDAPLLDAGDILEHPKLGRCHVMKVEDQNYAHIRLPRGKIRKLSLSVVDVHFKGEEDGRNVFEAQVAK